MPPGFASGRTADGSRARERPNISGGGIENRAYLAGTSDTIGAWSASPPQSAGAPVAQHVAFAVQAAPAANCSTYCSSSPAGQKNARLRSSGAGLSSLVQGWRGRDSNPRYPCGYSGLETQSQRLHNPSQRPFFPGNPPPQPPNPPRSTPSRPRHSPTDSPTHLALK
jgi:hypothetical protein